MAKVSDSFYKESKSKKKNFFEGVGGGWVSEFFYRESKSKKKRKKIYFLFSVFGGGGG